MLTALKIDGLQAQALAMRLHNFDPESIRAALVEECRVTNQHVTDEQMDALLARAAATPIDERSVLHFAREHGVLVPVRQTAPRTEAGQSVPELPASASVPDDRGAGGWLDGYVAYARSVSPMTPRLFHEGAGLALAAIAIARRLKLEMPHGAVFPNLSIVWLAGTTLYRKSTGLDVARDVARRTFPHLLAPQDATPEAWLSDLAGRPPAHYEDLAPAELEIWKLERAFAAQRGLVLDEMSGLMAAAGRDYNAGQLELLLRLHDCDPRYTRSTRGQGRVTVQNAYLTILGASTPAAMAVHLVQERLWSMGWWPRFAILTPEGRPQWEEPTATGGPPTGVLVPLCRLYARLPAPTFPDPARAIAVDVTPKAYEAWQRYSKALSYDLITDALEGRLHGTYGRLPTQVLKVATILAATDWEDADPAPCIGLAHIGRAIAICEGWRASAHRALDLAGQTDASARLKRLLRQIGRLMPAGASLRDLCRAMSDVDPHDIEKLIEGAMLAGYLVVGPATPGPKGGRPTQRYYLAAE